MRIYLSGKITGREKEDYTRQFARAESFLMDLKKNHKDEEIFSFRMVAEPDSFGKWKIFSFEREGKE